MSRSAAFTLLLSIACAGLLSAQPTPDIFWFGFNESSGNSSANDGTLAGSMFGGFTVTTTGVFTDGVGAVAPGRIQPGAVGTGAVNLSSTVVWLDTGLPGTTLNSSSFTAECWINTNGVTQEGNVIFSICTSSAVDIALYLSSASNELSLQVPTGLFAGPTPVSLLAAGWNHVALVYDRTAQTATGYVNGVQEFQVTSLNLTLSSGSNVVFLNGRTTSPFGNWTARADEARFHSTALTAGQLADTLAPVSPPGGGGGGDGGGDDEGCSTTGGSNWMGGLITLTAVCALALRRRRVQA